MASTGAAVEVRSRPRRTDAAHAKFRQARAIELALAGKDYSSIAREIGYANRSGAWKLVQKALRERVVEDVDALREREVNRLDRVHRAFWPAAIAGDLAAANVILRTMEQRARLLGLEYVDGGGSARPVSIVVGGTR